MKKWQCTTCDYIYDPELGEPYDGIAPGTPFEKVPESWTCPECGEPKSEYAETASEPS